MDTGRIAQVPVPPPTSCCLEFEQCHHSTVVAVLPGQREVMPCVAWLWIFILFLNLNPFLVSHHVMRILIL